MSEDLLQTVELNGARIEVYKNSVVFYDTETEECWEYEWKDLFRLTDRDR